MFNYSYYTQKNIFYKKDIFCYSNILNQKFWKYYILHEYWTTHNIHISYYD